MLLTFPVMGIKLNSVDQTVEWQFDRVILLGVAIFFLSMLWNWCFSRKARGIPLIRLPEGLGKGLHSLVTLPNRNTTTRLTSLGLLLAVMIVMPLVSSFYQTNIMISAMLYVILALGLNIAVGIAGQLVLGYVAFYAVGAYSYALLNQAFGLGFWACLPVGGFMAIVFGLALGFPVLRLRGDYLAIVTLAFGEIIKNVINVLYVGADANGIHIAMKKADLNLQEGGQVIIEGAKGITGTPKAATFAIGIILVLLTLFIVLNLMNSRSGRAIMAIRDNRIAAESVGINITKYKLMAFSISASLAGVAGVLYAHNLSSLAATPKSFGYNMSIMILVYVVLGGIGNIRGSIIAAVILTLLPELLRGLNNYRMLIYAVVLIVMMLFNSAPKAIAMRERIMEKFHKKNAKEAA